jgi:hypothetical protein
MPFLLQDAPGAWIIYCKASHSFAHRDALRAACSDVVVVVVIVVVVAQVAEATRQATPKYAERLGDQTR